MTPRTIAIIGGTGKLGAALAGRWTKAGHSVLIGSRDPDAAVITAQRLSERFSTEVRGAANAAAAADAELVVLTVPFGAQEATIAQIRDAVRGKLVIDTTVPLIPPRVMRVQLPPEGSAAERAARLLGPK